MRGVWAPCMLWLAILTVLWALIDGGLVAGDALGLDGLGWQLALVSCLAIEGDPHHMTSSPE